jgi:hypothetical protein
MGALIVIALVLVALVIFFAPTLGDKFISGRGINKDAIRKHWQKIENYFERTNTDPKHAVTEADKLLDYVLRKQHYGGTTMAERIKNAEIKFDDREAVWAAHKLRNKIVHEHGFEVGKKTAQTALRSVHHALKNLGAL